MNRKVVVIYKNNLIQGGLRNLIEVNVNCSVSSFSIQKLFQCHSLIVVVHISGKSLVLSMPALDTFEFCIASYETAGLQSSPQHLL